jgi:hypothetical protein
MSSSTIRRGAALGVALALALPGAALARPSLEELPPQHDVAAATSQPAAASHPAGHDSASSDGTDGLLLGGVAVALTVAAGAGFAVGRAARHSRLAPPAA